MLNRLTHSFRNPKQRFAELLCVAVLMSGCGGGGDASLSDGASSSAQISGGVDSGGTGP